MGPKKVVQSVPYTQFVVHFIYGGFLKCGFPKMDGEKRENSTKMDGLGVPPFLGTPNAHVIGKVMMKHDSCGTLRSQEHSQNFMS